MKLGPTALHVAGRTCVLQQSNEFTAFTYRVSPYFHWFDTGPNAIPAYSTCTACLRFIFQVWK